MDVIQINMLQDLISKKCFRNFLKCSTLSPKSSSLEASIPSELNAETYLESNDPALSLTSTSKKMEIKELKKEIWSFSSSKIPKIPESAADRQYADSHSFLEIANQFYFPQIMEEKEEICSIHSLFVCMLHLANENKLYFEADKKKGRKDMNFQVWRYEDPREVDQDKE